MVVKNSVKIEVSCTGGVMVKELACVIVAREFELKSGYYVDFRTNTLGKGMHSLILPSMG